VNFQGISYWLETVGEPLTPRPSLKGDIEVDVAILGGGYSGLWTAYYLLQQEPSLEIAIVEREICGYGASGRNGGWCSPRFPINPDVVERRHGADVARQTVEAMFATVAEVGEVCARENIDAQFRTNGIFSFARGEAQVAAVVGAHELYERLGLGAKNRLLNVDEARERVNISGIRMALHTEGSGTVHPAKLVRGLARTVERKGAAIYEQTTVRRMETGARPALVTDNGVVRARRAVIAAGEAYLSKVPGLERTVLPMSSSIVLTEPLSDAQWREIGWAEGDGLGSQAYTVDYLTKTDDGRILYGSRGAPYYYGSETKEMVDGLDGVLEQMRARLREWFPPLESAKFTHAWSGYLGVTRDWTPSVVFDADAKSGRLCGYTGRGVATSNLAARILSSKILGRETALSRLPLSDHQPPAWEPEPLRWLGVRYIQNGFKRMDEARDSGRPAPLDAAIVSRLSAP
jgi:glycine/D-amino acid oxidase-like deaminating enzyme